MRTQRRKGLHHPPASTLSSPLYQRILQFKALSSLRQQGTDVRRFALEFRGAAEGLGFNDPALKDLFNSALDEPLNWWRMRGLDHLTFGGFGDFLTRSPAMEAAAMVDAAAAPVVVDVAATPPDVPAEEAAVPLVVAEKAAAPPQWWPMLQLQRRLMLLRCAPKRQMMLQLPQRRPTMPKSPALGDGGGGTGRRLLPSFKASGSFQSPLLARRPSLSRPSSLPCRSPPSSLP